MIMITRGDKNMKKYQNEIASWIEPGLEKWSRIAAVSYLGELKVPQIVTPPRPLSVLVLTGHHLEETSGPKFALEPDNFEAWMKDFGFVIFPIINQYGLNYPADSNENLLRKDRWGRNYNSGWGKRWKAEEVGLVETDITPLKFDVAVSLHEDSTTPGEGSFYANGVNGIWLDRFLDIVYFDHNFPLSSKPITIDEKDGQSCEYWLSKRGISTFLIEAPFGLPMKDKLAFVGTFFNAILNLVETDEGGTLYPIKKRSGV